MVDNLARRKIGGRLGRYGGSESDWGMLSQKPALPNLALFTYGIKVGCKD
jgi:hypothetical protein